MRKDVAWLFRRSSRMRFFVHDSGVHVKRGGKTAAIARVATQVTIPVYMYMSAYVYTTLLPLIIFL